MMPFLLMKRAGIALGSNMGDKNSLMAVSYTHLCSPGSKRCTLGVRGIDPLRAGANALSVPPGELSLIHI